MSFTEIKLQPLTAHEARSAGFREWRLVASIVTAKHPAIQEGATLVIDHADGLRSSYRIERVEPHGEDAVEIIATPL